MTRKINCFFILIVLALSGCKTVMEYRLDECNYAEILEDSSDTANHAIRKHGSGNTDDLYASYIFDPESYVVCSGRHFKGEGYNADPYNTWYGAQYYLQAPDNREISPLENPSFISNRGMTLAGWFKTTKGGTILSKCGDQANSREYRIFIQGGTLKATIWNLYGGPSTTTIANNVNDGEWHAYAITARSPRYRPILQIKTYFDGSLKTQISQNFAGYCKNTNGPLIIGAMNWGNGNITDFFDGSIDEIIMTNDVIDEEDLEDAYQEQLLHRNADGTTRNCPNCANDLHHLEITHDGSAIACIPEQITIRACADAACNSLYLDGVSGTLNVGGNSTSFSIPPEASETTVSIYVPADGTSNDDPPQLVTLAVGTLSPLPESGFSCSNTSTSTENCQIEVHKAGLDFDVPHLKAGTAYSSITINAIQTSDEDPTVCTPLFESGERSVCFWGQYENPTTGTGEALRFNGNNIDTVVAGTAPECTLKTLTFTNGSATLPEFRYDDVGKMQLHARYEGSEEHDDEGLIVIGSDSFVVKPHHFSIDSIKCSDGTENLEATNSEGKKFCRTGEDFYVQLSAKNAHDDLTRNFGRETEPESVRIERELVLPSGGISPELNAVAVTPLSACDGNSADATFCVTTAWPEVGIIKLIPGVGDGDYLEAGDVNETAAEHVGRFYPDHFELTQVGLTNREESGCPDSDFTYLGENLEFTYTLTAKNAAGGPTKNYIGDFAKFNGTGAVPFGEPGSYTVAAIDEGSDTLLKNRLDLQSSSMLTPWYDGVAKFKVKLHVNRADSEDGPFNNTIFGVSVVDSDHVSIADLDLDADDDGTNEHMKAAPGTILRYGRLNVANAHGSELLPIKDIEVSAEYYDETHNIFRLNNIDSCTSYDAGEIDWDTAEYFDGLNQNISATGTGDLVKGRNTFSIHQVGDSETGPGTTGHVLYKFPTDSYLQFDWNGDGSYDENPSARATFGIFKGNERIIYLRETTWH